MKKRQRNPVVITNVYHLAKVGVVGSNPITRSRFSKILSILFIGLRRFLLQILSCIFAVLIVLWCIGYALEMQFMELRKEVPTQSRHTMEGEFADSI